jgi:hypothetical protein
MDRRTFARAVTAGALAPAALAAAASVDVPAPAVAQVPATPPLPAPQGQQQQPEPSASARALVQVLRERFGNRFTDEQYAQFERTVELALRRGATLREQRLTNADEPAFVFTPFRREP